MHSTAFRISLTIIIILITLLPTTSYAFNKAGHQTIASLSYRLLDDNGKQYLKELLGSNARQEWTASAYWPAEQAKNKGQEWRIPLHRIWFSENDSAFNPDQHCPFNSCSVGAILESRQILLKPEFTKQYKRQAIKYLSHYIGDAHQPTNCGFLRDEGGRLILLKTPDLTRVNLHWVWEDGLIQLHGQNWSQLSSSIRLKIDMDQIANWQAETSPETWGWQCHQVAKTIAYPLAETGKWGMAYYKEAWPTYETQLLKAASRVAATVNELAKEVRQ